MAVQQATAVYRKLLRSAGAAFKGDVAVLSAARQEIRSQFENSRTVSDPAERQSLLQQGEEAADFLRTQVVQAAVNERGNYEMAVDPDHLGGLLEPASEAKLPREKKKKEGKPQ